MKSTMMGSPLTAQQVLERAGNLFPESEIVSRQPDRRLQRYRYSDFYMRSRALSEGLTGLGLRPGDRVATLMWNHASHLEAYFGIPCAGGVLHTLNLRLHSDDLAYIVNHARDRFLIVDDVLLPVYRRFQAQTPNLERVIVVSSGEQPTPSGLVSYEELIGGATGSFDYPQLAEEAPLGMCYTSGTTGRPKGVVYSHRSTLLHTLALGLPDVLNIGHRETVMPVVPMFHANAWGLPFLCALVGCKQVFPGPHLDPVSLLDLCCEEQVTFTAGVPTIWMGILDQLEKSPGRWKLSPSLRTVVGGSAAPRSLIQGFERHGIEVLHAWGMTETSPLGTVSRLKRSLDPLDDQEKLALQEKQGLPVPLIDIRIWGEAGPSPSDGRSMGELQVRGPWVADSYFEEPNRESWTEDGWFRTGDVATLDPQGYMRISDRTKDLIKSGGEWISSVSLENALMGHPGVLEAAVFAIPHPRWHERPLAAVVRRGGAEVSEKDLLAHLEKDFVKWWLPEGIVFLPEIPKNPSGKFLKSQLRERFREWKRSVSRGADD